MADSDTRPTTELSEERRAIGRLHWYILLRWSGVAVIYAAVLASRQIAHARYSLTAANVLAPLVVAYNIGAWRLIGRWRRVPPRDWRRAYRLLGDAQCSADLLVLAVGLHFSGGIESLGSIDSIAVLVVAGIVLEPLDSLLQGLFACALFDATIIAEGSGPLHHVNLGFLRPELVRDGHYIASIAVLYDSIVLFIVSLVVFLAHRLRRGESELAGLYEREHETVNRLEELDRLKTDFLAAVSHELRTPLAAINGFAHNLSRNWDRTSEDLRREQIAGVSRQSGRLQRLVEHLLDFSAIEAGVVAIHSMEVDVAALVSESVSLAGVDGVVAAVPSELRAMADASRTEEVLVNLLENARKYGSPPITVGAEKVDGEVIITVGDRGPGIPPERVDELFTPFQQFERGPTRKQQGVGLGLALVRGYVEAQGGRAWYEPVPEGGARFSFSLPASG